MTDTSSTDPTPLDLSVSDRRFRAIVEGFITRAQRHQIQSALDWLQGWPAIGKFSQMNWAQERLKEHLEKSAKFHIGQEVYFPPFDAVGKIAQGPNAHPSGAQYMVQFPNVTSPIEINERELHSGLTAHLSGYRSRR